jgi:hypothetical protein
MRMTIPRTLMWAAAESVDKLLHVFMETEKSLPSCNCLVVFMIFW